jgi:predicted Fe-S protein YdhL (DUF1289 family)
MTVMRLVRDEDPIPSPCISICKMDPAAGTVDERAAGGLCVGCLRTLDEIVEWGTASDPRKRAIVQAIASRTADG